MILVPWSTWSPHDISEFQFWPGSARHHPKTNMEPENDWCSKPESPLPGGHHFQVRAVSFRRCIIYVHHLLTFTPKILGDFWNALDAEKDALIFGKKLWFLHSVLHLLSFTFPTNHLIASVKLIKFHPKSSHFAIFLLAFNFFWQQKMPGENSLSLPNTGTFLSSMACDITRRWAPGKPDKKKWGWVITPISRFFFHPSYPYVFGHS